MKQQNKKEAVIPAKAGIHMDPDFHRGDEAGNGNGKSLGFTLVELAIALMVIGLLIGGVLKGQELIENAKITSTIRQLNAYDAATLIFRNTYNALPGDIKRPNRIPNCTTDLCLSPGTGNGRVDNNETSPTGIETNNFFPHLTKAGMIQGPEGGTQAQAGSSDNIDLFFPRSPVDRDEYSYIYAHYKNSGGGYERLATFKHIMQLGAITAKIASAIDTKMDDGLGWKGSVQADDNVDCLLNDEEGDISDEYDIQNTDAYCLLLISVSF